MKMDFILLQHKNACDNMIYKFRHQHFYIMYIKCKYLKRLTAR